MALAKTKKAATKKSTAVAKPKAKKASPKAKAKPKQPEAVFENNTFAKFTGYRNEVEESEIVFEEGEIVYIIGHEEDDETGLMYTAIKAGDIAEYEANGTEGDVTGGECAPSELSKVTGRALEKVEAEYTPVPVFGRLEEMLAENSNAIEVAIELNHQKNETYFWMGGALAMVMQSRSYLKENGGDYEGEKAWNDFCQAEFDFKGSKGHDLIRIYRVFSTIEGFDPSKIDTVGWSKAAMAANYVTPDNVDEIIETCEETPQSQLREVLKTKYIAEDGKTAAGKTAGRPNTIKRVTMSFTLDEMVAEGVEVAIQQCIKQQGFTGPEKLQQSLALEHICVEWANEHVQAKTHKAAIQKKINQAAKAREASAKPAATAKATKPKTAAKPRRKAA